MKFEIRGRRRTAILTGQAAALCPLSAIESESSLGRGISAKGTTPSTGTPVSSSSFSTPGAKSSGSPRNLLTMTPTTRGLTSSGRRASVPYTWAKTPPRSISATRTMGRRSERASRMFAMSRS